MSLDPESLLGIKSAVLKAAVAGTMLGVLWRKEFTLAEALSSAAAGLGSAMWIAPALLAHVPSLHEDIRAGVIFCFGMAGIHVFALVSNHGPSLLRRLVRSRLLVDPDDPASGKPKGGAQ